MDFRPSYQHLAKSTFKVIGITGFVVLLLNAEPYIIDEIHAQVIPPITPSGLNTAVTQNGNTYNITGGSRPGGGTNLFHSFGNFNVPTNNIANFLNAGSVDLAGNPLAAGLPTSNILGRVTGGNASNIFGTIQTIGFGNANLFLMNPAGFLFGPKATVNVGGMMTFTSADYVKLADGARFNAIPNAAADALLSAAPVAAYGFLGSNPGAITVQGSQFTVTEGTGISLVGGNITIQSGTLDDGTIQPARLSAPGGQINLASVASPGEVLFPSLQTGPNINGQSFTSMGTVALSEGSTLDVSADTGGTIKIRGGQLMIADATLSADTGNGNGSPVAIDINLAGDLSISDTRALPSITATTTGAGNAGEVRISSANLDATSTVQDLFPVIDTHTSGDGRAGNVTITTGNLHVSGPHTNAYVFIDTGTTGPGNGGDVVVSAHNIVLDSTTISTGDFIANNLLDDTSGVTGSAGNLTITADSLQAARFIFDTSAFIASSETQLAGNITLNVRNISMINGQIGSGGMQRGGTFTINADSLVTDFTFFETDTFAGSGVGGGITVNARIVNLTNGSSLISSTFGDSKAGDILVNAGDHVSLIGRTGSNSLGIFRPTGFFSNAFGTFGNQGTAGDVVVSTPRLEMTGGRINTVTKTSGHGGNVALNVTDTISISGEFPRPLQGTDLIFDIGPLAPSGVITSTIGGACSGLCGNAGRVSISTGSLSLGSGGQIDSGTSNTGSGGNIIISAMDGITLSGTMSDGTPSGIFSRTTGAAQGSGNGGNIALTAGQSVTISNGASVSASSTGPGNTGNIQINAGNQFAMTNSTVTTEANQASGGAIKITTNPSGTVQLTNSTISASVLDGTGGGGSVNIDPQYVIMQNSQILANAVQGPGGNITIAITNGGLFLPDANSIVSASSQFGVNGTVTIQSPNAPASGKIVPLSQKPLLATSLLSQRCAALAGGEFSSFTVAGRDSLPVEPGGWLTSPLAALSADARPAVRGEGRAGMTLGALLGGETALLSLRQIAPAGFLTQAFAVDESAGCQS